MPRKASSTLPKRSRASKPKFTTGCLTCKIRHLKCDEARPHCHRCLSTGRTCDGYSPPRPPLLLSSALSTLPTLPGTPLERHSFHHFHTYTTPHLHFPFSSPFWSQHVLQASLHEKAIWHAAVALGALHAGEEAFAVRQYVKAIGCLTRMDAGRRVDVALMGCVLFTCFETLRSHHSPALLHLDNGVNLLLELQSPLPAKTSNPTYITPPDKRANPAYPRTPYTPLPTLHTLLTRLDTQATQLLPSRQTRLRPVSVPPLYYEGFASLEEAKGASDELWNYCLYSLQPEPESPSSSPFDLHQYPYQQQKLSLSPTHADLARRQESYTTALSAFLTTHPPRTPREQEAGDILHLHALVATLSLSPASLSA